MWAWTPPCSAPDESSDLSDVAIVKTSRHWLRPLRCQKSHLIWRVFCTCSINQVLSRSCLHRCQSGDQFDPSKLQFHRRVRCLFDPLLLAFARTLAVQDLAVDCVQHDWVAMKRDFLWLQVS